MMGSGLAQNIRRFDVPVYNVETDVEVDERVQHLAEYERNFPHGKWLISVLIFQIPSNSEPHNQVRLVY